MSTKTKQLGAVAVVTFLALSCGDGVARFDRPHGVAIDPAGNVYVADMDNHSIRKITAAGMVTTVAGRAGSNGHTDGSGTAARFYWPHGLAADSAGNLYVADTWNATIRKITPSGAVTTLAGRPRREGEERGLHGGFNRPQGIAVDRAGNVYTADASERRVRKITPAGEVIIFAEIFGATGVATDASGRIYVVGRDHVVHQITADGPVTTIAGLAGSIGNADGTGSAARFHDPSGIAVDSSGNLYVADTWNSTIRKVTRAGVVTTLAGLAGMDGSVDGIGSAARFRGPTGIACDPSGNIYVADTGNHTIRKITPDGRVTTLAGVAGSKGDTDGSGPATGR